MKRSWLANLFVPVLLLVVGVPSWSHAAEHGEHTAVADEPTSGEDGHTSGARDSRTPLFLLPMMAQHQKEQMRDHLLAIQEIIEAASREGWQDIEASAGRIGYSESMATMCDHMGAATPGFSEVALRFHRTADLIAEAARAHDTNGVLKQTAATVAVCTGCHATYKQEIVDEAEWQRLTGMQAPVPGGDH
jgi:hypothetical protein